MLEKLSLNLTTIEQLYKIGTTLILNNIDIVEIDNLQDLLNGNYGNVTIDLSKLEIDSKTLSDITDLITSGSIINAAVVTLPIAQILIDKFELGKDTMNTLRNVCFYG